MKRYSFSTRFLGGGLKLVDTNHTNWASVKIRVWKLRFKLQVVYQDEEHLADRYGKTLDVRTSIGSEHV